MNKHMSKTNLQKFIIVSVAIMPILSPVFVEFGWLNSAPEDLKTAWGVLLVLTALSWWIVDKHINSNEIKLVKSSYYLPIWLFISWCFITLFWAEDGYLATIMMSQFISYALIFTLIINIFKSYESAILIPKYLMISMLFIATLGLIQYYFPNHWFVQHGFMQTAEPGSTFANKNMASHFMVMALPLSFFYLLNSKNRRSALTFSILFFISFWFLINTTARQAYVAISLQIILVSVFFILDKFKNKEQSFLYNLKDKKFKSMLFIGILVGLFLVSNLTKNGWDFDSGLKTENLQRINIEGGNARFPAWINTTELIKDNFLTGVGVGQWPQAYPLYHDRIMKDGLFNEKNRLQRLHNDYLETLSNVGIVGFIFLIWIFILVIRNIFSVVVNPLNKYRLDTLALALGLFGFLVVALFSFPIRVYLPAFLVTVYMALIFIISGNNSSYFKIRINNKTLLVAIFVVIFSSYLSIQTFKWVKAGFHYNNATILSNNKMNSIAIVEALKSLRLNDKSPKIHIRMAELLVKNGDSKKAIPYLKKAIDISPYHTKALILLSSIYHDSGNSQMERKVLEFVLTFDARNVKALAFLVKNLSSNGRGLDASIVYKHLQESFEYFKNRNNFGPYHSLVGLVATSVSDFKYARYIYKDEVSRFPSAQSYYNLAILEYDYLKNHEQGVIYAKKALAIDPMIDIEGEIKSLIDIYETSVQH